MLAFKILPSMDFMARQIFVGSIGKGLIEYAAFSGRRIYSGWGDAFSTFSDKVIPRIEDGYTVHFVTGPNDPCGMLPLGEDEKKAIMLFGYEI